MGRYAPVLVSLLSCAVALTGCARSGARAEPRECAPRAGELAADLVLDELVGEYRLTLVATKGDSSGNRVQGSLSLHRQEGDARRMTTPSGDPDPNVSVPLYGATDIDLEAIGAVRLGDLGSLDPMSPGVMVLDHYRPSEGAASRQVTIRLGSLANRRDIVRFDGGYAALRLGWVADEGFGGTWASGVRGPEAAGYFCAFRESE